MSSTFVLRQATSRFIFNLLWTTLHLESFSETSPAGSSCWRSWFQPTVQSFDVHHVFKDFYQSAGGSSPFMSLLPTKLLMNWEDITADHRDVPAVWTVVQAVTILGYASSSLRFFDDFEKVYFDRYFESPSTSGPICYAIPLYISLLPFDVTQRVIHFSSISPSWVFNFSLPERIKFSSLQFSVPTRFRAVTC